MIKSIRLVNWRSHSDTRLQFRKGTNLLVGIMGAGKSSVLEAASFAFFGTFPALERRKLKLDDIVRLNEGSARVVLDFEWDGTEYRVERSIERSRRGSGSGADLYRAGALLEHGPAAVTAAVRRITGVDYDLFTRAIYSEQNNIDYFLTLPAGRRKEEMDALLGLDRFEQARSSITTVLGKVGTKRKAIEERFSREKLESLEKDEKAHLERASALHARLTEASAALERQKAALEPLGRSFEDLKRKKDLSGSLEKDVSSLSGARDSLKKEAGPVDEAAYEGARKRLSAFLDERAALTSAAKSTDEKNTRLSRDAGTLDARLRSAAEAAERLAALEKELAGYGPHDALLAAQKEAEGRLLSYDSERKSLEREAAEIAGLVARLKPGVSECPMCASKISDVSHIRDERNAAIAARKARAAELDKLCAAGVEAARARKAGLDLELSSLQSERQAVAKRLEALTAAIEPLQVEVSGQEAQLRRKKELELTERKLADAVARLGALQFEPAAFERAQKALEDGRLAFERLSADRRSVEAEHRHTAELLRMVSSELSSLRAMAGDAAALARLEEELAIYRNAVVETQVGLRASLIDAINTAMNEIWPIFYPYGNYPAIRLEVTEKDYMFEVNDGSAWKLLESTASGGERASAALTLRVALAMVLTPKLSWLILDEPTHNLDADAIEMLSSALQVKVPQVVNQTFVITHEEGLMGSEFASSYRLGRDKERNGETKAEAI
jgi:exonuclease SbcC